MLGDIAVLNENSEDATKYYLKATEIVFFNGKKIDSGLTVLTFFFLCSTAYSRILPSQKNVKHLR